jgi:hypothetical protein
MAEFDFFGTREDWWTVLEAIAEAGDITFVPDARYRTPHPLLFTSVTNALRDHMIERRHVYLWSKAFSQTPPKLVRQDSGPRVGQYFVQLDEGGPGLELTLPAAYEADGFVNLNTGSLSYPKKTWDATIGSWVNPSTALKQGYKEVLARNKAVSHASSAS